MYIGTKIPIYAIVYSTMEKDRRSRTGRGGGIQNT
jgi:hypothetical protein